MCPTEVGREKVAHISDLSFPCQTLKRFLPPFSLLSTGYMAGTERQR